jgi:hypothetical protein
MRLRGLKDIYIYCATVLLSVVIIMLLINGLCTGIIYLRDALAKDRVRLALRENMHAHLVGLNRKELSTLKKETWTKPCQYEP